MTTTLEETSLSPEMQNLKSRLKATWMAGDYGRFARYLEPGARMLDVACGAGQIAIPAAKTGVAVTGIDIAANLIVQAKARAAADGLTAHFDEGDAEDLPYPDASFDVVVSLIGAMFAPRPELVASELLRVCRPGGRIVMANWTPQGFLGQMFKAIGKHVPPPPLMPSPLLCGDEATVRSRFGTEASSLEAIPRLYPLHYPFSPAEVVDYFITDYGPTNRAHAALDKAGQEALRADLQAVWCDNNRATDGTVHVEAEYLEVTARRAQPR